MSFSKLVSTALSGLPRPLADPTPLGVRDGGVALDAELVALESLGCAFLRFEVALDSRAKAGLEELKQVAEQLTSRLTYLLEPICPIEIDHDACVVQLRSNPPLRNDDGSTYYELLVRQGGLLSLSRYHKPPGGVRDVVPAEVTREVFLRLADDFAAMA